MKKIKKAIVLDHNLPDFFSRKELFFGDIEQYKKDVHYRFFENYKKFYYSEEMKPKLTDEQLQALEKIKTMEDLVEIIKYLSIYDLNTWNSERRDIEIITDEKVIKKRECARTLWEIQEYFKDRIKYIKIFGNDFDIEEVVENIEFYRNKERELNGFRTKNIKLEFNLEEFVDKESIGYLNNYFIFDFTKEKGFYLKIVI